MRLDIVFFFIGIVATTVLGILINELVPIFIMLSSLPMDNTFIVLLGIFSFLGVIIGFGAVGQGYHGNVPAKFVISTLLPTFLSVGIGLSLSVLLKTHNLTNVLKIFLLIGISCSVGVLIGATIKAMLLRVVKFLKKSPITEK
jgi:hypothetical protein